MQTSPNIRGSFKEKQGTEKLHISNKRAILSPEQSQPASVRGGQPPPGSPQVDTPERAGKGRGHVAPAPRRCAERAGSTPGGGRARPGRSSEAGGTGGTEGCTSE